jgi:hypothetical protein
MRLRQLMLKDEGETRKTKLLIYRTKKRLTLEILSLNFTITP